jgi:hypothetical protein
MSLKIFQGFHMLLDIWGWELFINRGTLANQVIHLWAKPVGRKHILLKEKSAYGVNILSVYL